jgi:competence protein ComEA
MAAGTVRRGLTRTWAKYAPQSEPRWLLRRTDQAVIAVVVLGSLVAMIGWYLSQGGWQGRLIELDRTAPLAVQFQVDINAAAWPELVQLPGVGETLARRIVDSREHEGPFVDHSDLLRVQGIGPKTLERIRPYLRPMPQQNTLAGH